MISGAAKNIVQPIAPDTPLSRSLSAITTAAHPTGFNENTSDIMLPSREMVFLAHHSHSGKLRITMLDAIESIAIKPRYTSNCAAFG